jgi:hypothetical protein
MTGLGLEVINMSYSYGDEVEQGLISDCCGAQVIYIDLCSGCKEHYEPIEEEPEENE